MSNDGMMVTFLYKLFDFSHRNWPGSGKVTYSHLVAKENTTRGITSLENKIQCQS